MKGKKGRERAMPKAPKRSSKRNAKQRLDPLEVQIRKDEQRKFAKERTQKRVKSKRRGRGDENEGDEEAVPSDMSRKILAFAREQIQEEKEKQAQRRNENDEDEEDLEEDMSVGDEAEIERYMHEDHFQELQVVEQDERALEAFMNKDKPERRTLADIIMEKIKQKEQSMAARAASESTNQNGGALDGSEEGQVVNSQLLEVYKSVGGLLSRYRAGKVPKAFKIIPALRNWEQVLFFTHPEKWSPQAMFVATRLFASNLNQKMAQRFYALILLPAVRDDIAQNRRLNYHLYLALKKSLFRPAAFFKGILLPLCEQGDCTLKEATIIGSVLSKVSIPMMHSAAAMIKMASMPYSGATSLFLRVLLDKKYSLPYKVIDTLLRHFCAFRKETRELPVLWHQALLVFAQRYKNTLTNEQKAFIKPLLKQHFHYKITPEIRRELFFNNGAALPSAK